MRPSESTKTDLESEARGLALRGGEPESECSERVDSTEVADDCFLSGAVSGRESMKVTVELLLRLRQYEPYVFSVVPVAAQIGEEAVAGIEKAVTDPDPEFEPEPLARSRNDEVE